MRTYSSTKNNFDPSIGVVDTSKWSNGGPPGANPGGQAASAAKAGVQSHTPGLLSMPSAGPSSQDWNASMFRDEDPRKLNRMNSQPSASGLQSAQAARPAKMPLNFTSAAPPNGLLANNLSQTQLLESYQLAVQTNLISADLLNNKLPSDVLALLNQLFQTLNLYTNTINRTNSLNKRRAHLPPHQYKSELDLLQQESQTHKDNLLVYQKKINAAHMILKQQQQQQQQFQGPSLIGDNMGLDLSMLKDSQPSQSKLMQLIQEQKMAQQLAAQKTGRAAHRGPVFNSQWSGGF
ncbi:hypothetical protein BpHYR1_022643, partial [Brachionus plicatilis]